MGKFSYVFLVCAALLAGCKSQYKVDGMSDVDALEGKMLTLKVFVDSGMVDIDSARVVHGKFEFRGCMDSTMLANLFLDSQSLMPLVLEDGNVQLTINETQQSATGTPLNDTLSNFIRQKAQLDARLAELPHLESQMIMDGYDYDDVSYELDKLSGDLMSENEMLVTRFIRENYNNVLGPGLFMILTSSQPYPVLSPQIEEIVTDATPYFLGHPYVREYMRIARENAEKLQNY